MFIGRPLPLATLPSCCCCTFPFWLRLRLKLRLRLASGTANCELAIPQLAGRPVDPTSHFPAGRPANINSEFHSRPAGQYFDLTLNLPLLANINSEFHSRPVQSASHFHVDRPNVIINSKRLRLTPKLQDSALTRNNPPSLSIFHPPLPDSALTHKNLSVIERRCTVPSSLKSVSIMQGSPRPSTALMWRM